MTKREAKIKALEIIAGYDLLFSEDLGNDMPDSDCDKICIELNKICLELSMRAERLKLTNKQK